MNRFAKGLASAALLAGTALHAGCGSGASGLTTGSAALPADAPGSFNNADPASRPVGVAWTSARAKRCGFYFDPAKLKVNYLAYERTQGAAGEQLAKIEKSYDTTFKTTSDRVSGDAEYCTNSRGLEIKADLQRHLAGDYTAQPAQAQGRRQLRLLRLRGISIGPAVQQQGVLDEAGQRQSQEPVTRRRCALPSPTSKRCRTGPARCTASVCR